MIRSLWLKQLPKRYLPEVQSALAEGTPLLPVLVRTCFKALPTLVGGLASFDACS